MSVEAVGSFDEESLSFAPFIPSTPVLPAPVERSFASTLAPASNNPFYDLIDIGQFGAERITSRITQQVETDIKESFAQIEQLKAERDEARLHEELSQRSHNSWSTLLHVSEYVSGVAAFALGAATGGWGWVLAAAGIVGVGNRAIHDSNLLPTAVSWLAESKERQREILQQVETGAFYLSLGLGLAGGFVGIYTGAFAAAAQGTTTIAAIKKAATIAAAGSQVTGIGSKVGMEFYKKRIAEYNARAKEIDGETTLHGYTASEGSSTLTQWIDSNRSTGEGIQQSIRSLEVGID